MIRPVPIHVALYRYFQLSRIGDVSKGLTYIAAQCIICWRIVGALSIEVVGLQYRNIDRGLKKVWCLESVSVPGD